LDGILELVWPVWLNSPLERSHLILLSGYNGS
jgi:hypothetical protein